MLGKYHRAKISKTFTVSEHLRLHCGPPQPQHKPEEHPAGCKCSRHPDGHPYLLIPPPAASAQAQQARAATNTPETAQPHGPCRVRVRRRSSTAAAHACCWQGCLHPQHASTPGWSSLPHRASQPPPHTATAPCCGSRPRVSHTCPNMTPLCNTNIALQEVPETLTHLQSITQCTWYRRAWARHAVPQSTLILSHQ